MKSENIIQSAAVLAALAAPSLAGAQTTDRKPTIKADKKYPNIVLIIGDDCRFRDLGCYGNQFSITPNIDRIAAEGMKFERFFQATAMSSPTRQCLLTGLYPVRNGAYPNHTFISEGVRTLPDYLLDCGYRVATQGKRHYAPLAQFPFEFLDGIAEDAKLILRPEVIEPFLKEVSETGEAFFLYCCSTEPHDPWNKGDQSLFDPEKVVLPPNLVNTPETRRQYCNYLAEINYLDNHVGQIDEMLHRYGLADNTVFIFTSEQGYSFPFGKWTCYDEGLETGMLIRWPGVVKPGSTSDKMCEYVDMTPTLIDIAGGKPSEELDGRSFKKILQGKRSAQGKDVVFGIQTSRGIYAGPQYYGIRSARTKDYLYIRNLTPEMKFHCTAFTHPYYKSWIQLGKTDEFAATQVKRYASRPAEELYDVVNDPFQQHNLAEDAAYSEALAMMREYVDNWMAQQGDKGQDTEMEAFFHQASKMKVK